MTVKIGINRFGRMGRLGLRAGWGREDIVVTQVSEIATDAAGSAYLLKFDAVDGTWGEACKADEDAMVIDDTEVYASYDNEWGCVNRMTDIAVRVASK